MIRSYASLGVLLALVVASCTMMPPPVPVIGTPPDALALAGRWDGEYSSVQTHRYGTIRFLLEADSDSAFGDVLMLTRHTTQRTAGNEVRVAMDERPAQTLSISFVVTLGDSIFGLMDPYEEVDGSILVTRFTGLMQGDRIEGRYLTLNLRTSETTAGQWSVRRKP